MKEHKREVNVADPKTFKLIDYYFGKDNINVYYLSQESPDLKILE
ncbi:MAG: DKNYY domain-containing protein [bacterium]